MALTWDLVLLLGGLVFLFFGGEALVRGSVALAERLRISKLVVGMVIIGFGTSAPELLVSLRAAIAGSPDIAIGNVVGSNIANVLLIVGLAALIAPITNSDKAIRRDVIVMLTASLGLFAILLTGQVSRLYGVAMLAALVLYLAVTYRLENRRRASAFIAGVDEVAEFHLSPAIASIAVLAGLVLLVVGAKFMVDGATGIARGFGVSEAVIGLTIVAVGTSLPELATALVAAVRRHADVVLANIVGSNIFNILAILGITAMVTPIPVATRFAAFDTPVMIAVAIAMLGLLLFARTIGRPLGAVLLAAYAGYLVVQGYPI